MFSDKKKEQIGARLYRPVLLFTARTFIGRRVGGRERISRSHVVQCKSAIIAVMVVDE